MPFLLTAALNARGTPLADRLPELEKIAERLQALAGAPDWLESTVKSYVVLSLEFVMLQRKLEKSGQYLLSSEREAFERVYSNAAVFSFYYLSGLLLSEALWPNHHRLVEAFLKDFVPKLSPGARLVEVGVGTGYYLRELIAADPDVDYLGVDISELAIAYARRFAFEGEDTGVRARFTLQNAMAGLDEAAGGFDAAMCGEVLEHVEHPELLLQEFHRLLKPGGRLFMTTVVFAANIDHIYLFEDAQSIRDLIAANGFDIENEWVLPIYEGDSPDDRKKPMNYGAVLVNR